MNCPYCHVDAPTILRGVRPYCTACGAPRALVTTSDAVNVAGRPAKVGGSIAGVLGAGALGAGVLFALLVSLLAWFVFSLATALWVGGAVLFLTALVALPLMLGGRRLYQVGEGRARVAQEQAVFGLAAQRRGVLTAREVAQTLSIREEDADTMLTELARRPDGSVTLEVDDSGTITFVFNDVVAPRGRVRIDEQGGWKPARVPEVGASPQVIDAELIDEAPSPDVRHASR